LGDYNKCMTIIDEIRLPSKTNSEIAEVLFLSLRSLLHLRKQEFRDSFEYCIAGLQLLSEIEPTCFDTCIGYCWLVEVVYELAMQPKIEDKKQAPNPDKSPMAPALVKQLSELTDRSKLASRYKKSLSFVEQFAESFPIARPRFALLKGFGKILEGKSQLAITEYDKGLEIAKSLGMVYEEALLMYHKAKLLKNDDMKNQSKQKFPTIDCLALSPYAFKRHDKDCEDPLHPHHGTKTIRAKNGLVESD